MLPLERGFGMGGGASPVWGAGGGEEVRSAGLCWGVEGLFFFLPFPPHVAEGDVCGGGFWVCRALVPLMPVWNQMKGIEDL